MIIAILAMSMGAVVGAVIGGLLARQASGADLVQWSAMGAGIGAVLFWVLQALFKLVLRTLCWLGMGGLLGAAAGCAVLTYWPACPVPHLPHWLALTFAVVALLHSFSGKERK